VPPSQPDYKPFHFVCSTCNHAEKMGIYTNYAVQTCICKLNICKLGII
jgi:hypothetical protein